MCLMFIFQQCSRFFDAGTVLNQFKRPLLALFGEPGFGMFAHFLEEMPFQRPQGEAAVFCQRGRAPFGRLRPFRPILNMFYAGAVHKGVGS